MEDKVEQVASATVIQVAVEPVQEPAPVPRVVPVLRNLELHNFKRDQRVRKLNPLRGNEDIGTVIGEGTSFVSIRRNRSRDTLVILRNLEIIEDI